MKYLTRDEIQEILGIEERKCRALFNTEGFPVIRIGNGVYVREESFDAWMKQQEGQPKTQLDYSKV